MAVDTRFKKGFTPWNKNAPTSNEIRKKISKTIIKGFANGRIHPMQGKFHSEETKAKMRLHKGKNIGNKFSLGKIPWNKNTKGLQVAWNKGRKFPERSGINHPNWKGIKYTEDYRERRKFRGQLQKKVFERDDYTCQICGIRGVDLQVDHIQSWSEYVELRFNIENCRTVCAECHYKITFGKPMPPTVRAWGHNFLRRVEK